MNRCDSGFKQSDSDSESDRVHEEDKGRYGGLKRIIKKTKRRLLKACIIHQHVWSKDSGTAGTTTEAACLRV